MKNLCLTLILSSSLLLSGCYDLAEELWINSDGSGRMKFTIGIEENLATLMESSGEATNFCDGAIRDRSKFENNVLISSVAIKKTNEAGINYCTIDLTVKDFRNFAEVRNNIIEGRYDNYEFPFVIEELDEGRIRISQDFGNLGRDGPEQSEFEKAGQEMAMAMMTPMLSGKYITVRVHAAKIATSNGEISPDNRTTTWKKPLIDLIRHPEESHRFEVVMVRNSGFIDRIKSWLNSI